MAEVRPVPRLLLLRHGQVASHHGDLQLTDKGRDTAIAAGQRFGAGLRGRLVVFTGRTLRARQTAELFVAGARETSPGAHVDDPRVTFALRNPDLYVAGERVEMVSSVEALAEQVPTLSPNECVALPFFAEFIPAPDRIGWWLHHPDPPGDDAVTVAHRIRVFARSLLDMDSDNAHVFVGITHSPVLRSVSLVFGSGDPGEPPYLTGLTMDIAGPEALVRVELCDPFA